MADHESSSRSQSNDFVAASTQKRGSFFSDYIYLLKHNKKWWMLPLLVILLGFGALMMLSATGAAPFIYTLF